MSNALIRRMAFDIETQADPAKTAAMPEPEVLTGNLKDPAKIREKVDEARRQQIARAALNPHFGRVIAISVAERDDDTIERSIMSETMLRKDNAREGVDAAERELLTWFWDRVRKSTHFVSYNGSAFDIPFLMRRSLLLGVRPARIECGKYRVVAPACEHLDLYNLLADEWGNTPLCKQDLKFFVREIVGEECPYGTDFQKEELGRLFDCGQHDIIRQVCSWDCEATLRLCEAVEPVYA